MTRNEWRISPYVNYDSSRNTVARKESKAPPRRLTRASLRPGISQSWSDVGRKAFMWLSAGLFFLALVGIALGIVIALTALLWGLVVGLVGAL